MALRVLGKHRSTQAVLDFAFFDVGAGIDIRSVLQQVSDESLTIGTNGYLGTDGSFTSRKGVKRHANDIGSTPIVGLTRFYQTVVGGVSQSPSVRLTLAQSGGHLINVDTGRDYGAIGGAGGQPWSVAQFDDPNGPGGLTTCLAICTGVGGPYLFDGTAIRVPTGWSTNAPAARWVQYINGVLWFGGIPTLPSTVIGSALGAPEQLPFYNVVGVSQLVTGLGVVGAGAQALLAVGMNRGLSLIGGIGPSLYNMEVPSNDGVMAGRSMITVDGILYCIGETAIYRYDGLNFTTISDKVEPWILNDPLHQDFAMNGNRAISWAMYYNRRIYFWYDSGNTGTTNTALVWDLVRQGWTIYKPTVPFMCAAMMLAPEDPDPNGIVVGSAVTGRTYDFEVTDGGSQPLQFQTVSDDGVPFLVQCQTKFFKLGEPGTPKTLLRCYPELFTFNFNGSFTVVTDYGVSAKQAVVVNTASGGAQWDAVLWDAIQWPAENIVFTKPRLDYNLQGEAFAFGLLVNSNNPPFRWPGMSGTFAQQGRK